jgi:hypothetical protein
MTAEIQISQVIFRVLQIHVICKIFTDAKRTNRAIHHKPSLPFIIWLGTNVQKVEKFTPYFNYVIQTR